MIKAQKLVFILLFLILFSYLLAQELPVVGPSGDSSQKNGPGELVFDFSELARDPNSTRLDLTDYVDRVYSGASGIVKAEDMILNLGLNNWIVLLTPSARMQAYVKNSFVSPAVVKGESKRYAGDTILGVRVFFPKYSQSSAMILPPFKIPFYAGEDGNQFLGKGLIDNVKTMKEVKVTVYSLGYEADLEVLFEDMSGMEYVYPLGTLRFKGWVDLVWSNPNYLSSINSRMIKDNIPNYPLPSSKMRFKALRILKSHSSREQNFIFYVKDVRVIYDKLNVSFDSEIDNESTFKIYETQGIESLRKLKAQETFRKILKIKEGVSMSDESFQNFLEKGNNDGSGLLTKEK
ncbi:flagellar filament outer layer protein FlaA [Borrelia miyamotoi]|uniref:Flagellar filament outer layer protein FlaA n=1 Tax=Borrelia miyamotoi TaxID=47466 RepID=A0AAQ3AGP3_9SPIR|nr:flagellar filament outer layer protein FlaA [Borrelia miyamotoi]AJA58972.1 flagellar protein [Borrelia miyamotoi]AOW95863.1 flagellar protein [Borrelia miyamotoi]QTL83753.1 flagellar filament outer layer protein FlaA [Borrelia miyamotoi]WAZ84940.1 flagellar filament outer layer protein FlaA [Borrelia miyamotoi]WAZ90723.1 flagellar filament outer layer protein FlaA [Borrelia miyamotoi]